MATGHAAAAWWWSEGRDDAFQPDRTYVLNSLQYRFDPVQTGGMVWAGETENFSGLSTLTVVDLAIAGTSDLTARYEVNLKDEFEATTSSECHIYTAPLNLTCEEITVAELRSLEQNQRTNVGLQLPPIVQKKEIPLDFHFAEPSAQLNLYPNPASKRLELQLTGTAIVASMQWRLQILDNEGKEVLGQPFNGKDHVLDIAPLASGSYTIVVHSAALILQQRFVKP